ncbi:MAG: UDP-N-acetyl-2-amino-2-deoxyglucuronate dehydrogenase [Pseudomonadota bacterium]|nr:UDP-N-acetyl-2-amino-2-deoxyglucuronate dehydrogenase [Pseudomonadota bacterium]
MQEYKIAVLGCGAIFNRHLSAIQNNAEYYKLIGIYDPKTELQAEYAQSLGIKGYSCEDELLNDFEVNCVAILTPSNLHYTQAVQALNNKKNVILEKPATFLGSELKHLEQLAIQNGVKIFGVLQVRLNPAVVIAKRAIDEGLLGNIRSVALVQRWQRPLSYFTGWRGTMASGGGILREFGIHYLDVLQYLVGAPKVSGANFYNTKFIATDVSDTIYALFDFGKFGGSMEISIACEPKNIECSLLITSEQGYIKLGGKSLDEIAASEFLTENITSKFAEIKQQVLNRQVADLATQGASPYHPELYRQIVVNPERFALSAMYNVTDLVEKIYQFKN